MAKKKKKTFPKSKILELFKNKSYLKVVSKIKQFRIDGMDDLEVDALHINSLKILSDERFQTGDIQRAIRDIESALAIKQDKDLENFADAKVYASRQ